MTGLDARSPLPPRWLPLLPACLVGLAPSLMAAEEVDRAATPEGWAAESPREEIRPAFRFDPGGGPEDSPRLIIAADDRRGLDGYWTRTFPVEGGATYRFRASRRLHGVEAPRISGLVMIHWQDDEGRKVPNDRGLVPGYLQAWKDAPAEAEHPADGPTDPEGWTAVSGDYVAPGAATRAVVELHLRWPTPGGVAEWSDVSFEEGEPIPPRTVRLATVHLRPVDGSSPEDKRAQFEPMIAEAARQGADLVVLPETLTVYGTGLAPEEVAEPIPGPSTEFFGRLAREHDIHVVAGLVERDGHLVYNVAALIGPDGELIGTYRKVTLPTSESDAGYMAGDAYPVFETRFGKLGMMICYDGFFPEVARNLAINGAEVIAWPVWGCNPDLAEARAAENHVFVVSSTYEDVSSNWMISAVYDRSGLVLSRATEWGHGGRRRGRPQRRDRMAEPRRLPRQDRAASPGPGPSGVERGPSRSAMSGRRPAPPPEEGADARRRRPSAREIGPSGARSRPSTRALDVGHPVRSRPDSAARASGA